MPLLIYIAFKKILIGNLQLKVKFIDATNQLLIQGLTDKYSKICFVKPKKLYSAIKRVELFYSVFSITTDQIKEYKCPTFLIVIDCVIFSKFKNTPQELPAIYQCCNKIAFLYTIILCVTFYIIRLNKKITSCNYH